MPSEAELARQALEQLKRAVAGRPPSVFPYAAIGTLEHFVEQVNTAHDGRDEAAMYAETGSVAAQPKPSWTDQPDLVMLPFINGAQLHELNVFPGFIKFQSGPVRAHGVNGTSLEAVLAVCARRLEDYQRGPFACDENGAALVHVLHAIDALDLRTMRRRRQGVEGVDVAHVSDGSAT